MLMMVTFLTQWALSGYGIVNKPYFEIREHLENW